MLKKILILIPTIIAFAGYPIFFFFLFAFIGILYQTYKEALEDEKT